MSESDDPVAAIRQCLRIGARALRAAHITVDVDVIERSFHELETRFESRVTDAVDEIARTTSGLLNEEDGALTGTLSAFRAEFDQLLGDTFDAGSKVSVIAKIEELVLGTMKGLITPEIDDSPIGRLKKELVDTMQREVGDVAEEVRRVTEHLGIARRHRRRVRAHHCEGLPLRGRRRRVRRRARRRLWRPRRVHGHRVGIVRVEGG